jgi:chromosome transmission fidelity protein 18
MAHVIAKTAGYNVVEVNASDERSGDAIITKLDGALTAQYDISNPEVKKPILVVIDEIDVAVSGSGEKVLNNSFTLSIVLITTFYRI